MEIEDSTRRKFSITLQVTSKFRRVPLKGNRVTVSYMGLRSSEIPRASLRLENDFHRGVASKKEPNAKMRKGSENRKPQKSP